MKYEEIRVAKDYLDDLEKQHGKCNAIETLRNALEKQVSKPTEEIRTAMGRYFNYCPECNTKISEYKSVCPVYCSNCGQKLMH